MKNPNLKPEEHSYFHNWISVIGGIFSVIFAVVLIILFGLDIFGGEVNPYLEGFTYLIFPFFLILSLLLIPLGALRERKRRQLRGYVRRFPRIDFNDPRHQKWAFVTIAVVTLFLLFSAIGAYRAYQFTESTEFCGLMCHSVMEPEYTAYHHSPHARVACVECHIGEGAGWYVRSKLSGAYQIYSSAFNLYSRPIETPIKNLRPAQETCEQCHWPEKFFGAIEQEHEYFLPDETNSEWKTRMLMFVGGGTPPYGKGEGIHWHMNIKNKIYYVATDEKRQEIPWVKKIAPDGTETVYVAEGTGYDAANPPAGEMRKMDCMDCHNRPSHVYRAPVRAINEALHAKAIDATLPFIKREAVEALSVDYATKEEAAAKIREKIEKFYTAKYPELIATRKADIDQSIQGILDVYKINFFPEMKVSWKMYPDNIGHWSFPGCFRCHDGSHRSQDGQVITQDCNACHSIIAQGPVDSMEFDAKGLEFKHPEDIGEVWKEMKCHDCHTGGNA